MKAMTKFFFRIVAGLLVVAVLSGCNSNSAGSKGSTTSGEETSGNAKSVTRKAEEVVFWGWGSGDYFMNYYNQFAIDEPNYALNYDKGQVDFQELIAAIMAKNAPDLVYIKADYFPQLAYSKMIEPFDSYINEDTKFDIGKLNKMVVDIGSRDGKFLFWGDISGNAYYWNKSHYEEVGLDSNKAPKTWSELLSYSKALCKFDSTGIVSRIGFWDGWGYERSFYNTYLKDWFSEGGTKVDINNEDTIKTLTFAFDFPKNEFGGRDKIPMDIEWNWRVDTLSSFIGEMNVVPSQVAQLDAPWGMSYIPKPDDFDGEQKVPFSSSYGFFIPTGAKNPRGGWTYLRWYMDQGIVLGEGLKYDDKPDKFVPYINTYEPAKLAVDEKFTSTITDPNTLELIATRDEMIKNLFPLTQPISKSVFDEIYMAYTQQMIEGTITINDGVAQIQKELDIKIADWLKEQQSN